MWNKTLTFRETFPYKPSIFYSATSFKILAYTASGLLPPPSWKPGDNRTIS